jgi:hypothetical protein
VALGLQRLFFRTNSGNQQAGVGKIFLHLNQSL